MDEKTRDLKKRAMASIAKVEATLREWDPLSLAPGEMAPLDEYDSYAPRIVSMIERGCSTEELAAHLRGLMPADIPVALHPLETAERMIRSVRETDDPAE